MSTWFITGCSTGLRRALAEAVVARGHNVVATARDVSKLEGIGADRPAKVLLAPVDVTDRAQIVSAVRAGTERFGSIDVLVNNAGYGYRAAIEEGDDADVRTLFDTHVFGTVSTIKVVLPQMRARRSGAIVNLSSIGAKGTPAGRSSPPSRPTTLPSSSSSAATRWGCTARCSRPSSTRSRSGAS